VAELEPLHQWRPLRSVDLSTWRIRLNGGPLMVIECPSYMNPVLAAREVLLHGEPNHPDVKVIHDA
jgi:hypothetical protein